MSATERGVPEMFATFLYAACKFDQPDFLAWATRVARTSGSVDLRALVSDRS
jgi:hypothetical protein